MAYDSQGASPLFINKNDRVYLQELDMEIVEGDFTEIVQGYIRHDYDRVTQDLLSYMMRKEGRIY